MGHGLLAIWGFHASYPRKGQCAVEFTVPHAKHEPLAALLSKSAFQHLKYHRLKGGGLLGD